MFDSRLPARHPLSSIYILSISGRTRSAPLTRHTDFTSPPSIRSTVPVIQRAAGETMNAIKSAISSASPKRATPACLRNCRLASSSVIFLELGLFKHGQSTSRHYGAGRNAVDLDAILNAAFSKRLGQRFDCRIDRADCRRTRLRNYRRIA